MRNLRDILGGSWAVIRRAGVKPGIQGEGNEICAFSGIRHLLRLWHWRPEDEQLIAWNHRGSCGSNEIRI